jgi:hypothetical protein
VKTSKFSQFKNPSDVVAQVVALSRVSSVAVSDTLWSDVAATVTHSLDRLTGRDLATVMKRYNGPRDLVMLAGVCESLKYLPKMRLLRLCDLAEILTGLHRFNFVPSVEVLNVIAGEIEFSINRFKTRNIDLCRLLRYMAIMDSHSSLCVGYEDRFEFPDLVQTLQRRAMDQLGSMKPGELGIVIPYLPEVSLERFMVNFARSENTPPKVEFYFFHQLDRRFGNDAWKEFQYLLRPSSRTDATGWVDNKTLWQQDQWSDDESDEVETRRAKYELFRLDDVELKRVLSELPIQRGEARVAQIPPSPAEPPPIRTISDDQLAFLSELETEFGYIRKPAPVVKFSDRIERRIVRKRARQEGRQKTVSIQTKSRLKYKMKKKSKLFKFAVLANLVRGV